MPVFCNEPLGTYEYIHVLLRFICSNIYIYTYCWGEYVCFVYIHIYMHIHKYTCRYEIRWPGWKSTVATRSSKKLQKMAGAGKTLKTCLNSPTDRNPSIPHPTQPLITQKFRQKKGASRLSRAQGRDSQKSVRELIFRRICIHVQTSECMIQGGEDS